VKDLRREHLKHWISEQTKQTCELVALTGDASPRKYYRFMMKEQSFIAVDSPPELENNQLFVELSQAYFSAQLRAPVIHDFDLEQGFLWISDLGNCHLYNVVQENRHDVLQLYHHSLECLHKIRKMTQTSLGTLPCYDKSFLAMELELMEVWFVERLLGLRMSADLKKSLGRLKTDLVTNALNQNQVGVHRDFHSKNIMITDGSPSIIDYQGSLKGPIAYDIVSLLKDCYVELPEPMYSELLKSQYAQLQEMNEIDVSMSWEAFVYDVDLMGMQRHIKVLGIFSRLYLRDNKPDYLQYIPLILKYLETVSDSYVEFHFFSQWLRDIVQPSWERLCIVQ
jgi:aminoglycoside/choline kinase family phosphotransferase